MKTAVLALALCAAPAFAGGSDGLTFDQIREACQNPGQFQNQIAPTNLQVTCEERVTDWQPTLTRDLTLPRSRQITASLSSDKYEVSPTVRNMPVDAASAGCPSYKEVLETTAFTKATSCDEITEFKGNEQDFCASILDDARKGNPKMVEEVDTGRTVEFCAPEAPGRGQGGGRDQGGRDQGGKDQGKGQGK